MISLGQKIIQTSFTIYQSWRKIVENLIALSSRIVVMMGARAMAVVMPPGAPYQPRSQNQQ